MKRFFALLALIPALAFGAANDLQFSQINAAGTAATTHAFAPHSGTQFTTLAGFNTALGFGTGDSPVLTGLTLSGIATTRVPFMTTGGAFTSSSGFTFNSGTNALTATTFIGALSGNATSATTATTAGSATTAGTVTTAAQPAITSVGTLTGLTTGTLIGTSATNALNVAAGVTPFTELEVDSTSTSSPRGIMTAQFNTGTDGARLHFRKARGTRASPTVVVTGDNLGRLVGTGYDGTNYLEDTSIIFGTEGTVASTRVPTNIQFWTATDAAPSVLTQALILKSDQSATLAKNLTFGTAGSILSGTTGSQGITVTGTNESFTFSLNGTGSFAISNGTTLANLVHTSTANYSQINLNENGTNQAQINSIGTTFGTSARRGYLELIQVGATGGVSLWTNSVQRVTVAQSGNLLLSGLTTDAGAGKVLQIGGTNVINFGATSAATIGVSADTTAANVVVTTPATGSMQVSSLSGTGSRAVIADANGLLSAPVSDEIWKENMRAMPAKMGLATVLALRPLVFNYKDKSRFGAQDYVGFGARATSAILPQVTGQDRSGTFYLSDEKITAPLVLAVQQQQAQIEALTTGNADWVARGIALAALALAVRANLRKKS